jgi:uncharacterized iron-regulated membrane protein
MFRKILFWIHLPVGLIAGLVVLVMSFTGVMLTYERQILAKVDRNYNISKPDGAQRLPVEQLVSMAPKGPAAFSAVTLRSNPTEPAQLAMGQQGSIYLNPYTGAELGRGSEAVQNFFREVRNWHRWLAADEDNRETGKMITGASNAGFLFLVVSGLYLWFPRQLNWSQVRAVLLFRSGLSGKAWNFNWHNVIGFWTCIPLFFIVLGGMVISYPWASELVYTMTGSPPPPLKGGGRGPALKGGGRAGGGERGGREGRGGGGGSRAEMPLAARLEGVDTHWASVEKESAGWQSISLRIPESGRAPLVFTVDQGDGGQPQKRATVTVNRESGATERTTFQSGSAGAQWRSWLRFTHTGEYYGIIGQSIAGIASLGGVFLVWTGAAMALFRFNAWRRRRARQPAAEGELGGVTS